MAEEKKSTAPATAKVAVKKTDEKLSLSSGSSSGSAI